MIRLRAEVASRAADGLDGLKLALQSAIELEHATLPPYLYALYSIRPGSNIRLAAIIRSVAMEEMLHLALCCNVLNAIGGAPSLDKPDFIPVYPGPLPGAVAGIDIPLAPVSKSLIHDIFMEIEEPEDPLVFPVERLDAIAARAAPVTIGQFYQAIKAQMVRLATNGNIFVGNPARQLVTGLPGLIRVTDLPSAIAAIDLIVNQGEGTPASPLNPADAPAHYYLFAAAYNGRELVRRSGVPPFAYAGDVIPFDTSDIVRLATNPTRKRYEGTPAAGPNEQFNKSYTQLLKVLHRTFNGSPISILGSISLMRQLGAEARALAQIEFEPDVFAGPTFTYTPSREFRSTPLTPGDEMASFQQVQDVLEKVLGATPQPFHMPFWRGMSRDEFVAKKLIGHPLIVVGQPDKSQLVLALRSGASGPLRAYFGQARAGDEDLAVIKQWISDGCPEVAANRGEARSLLADAKAAGDDQHTAYWRTVDIFFHPFLALQPTKDHVLQLHGVALEAWIPTMLNETDPARWPNYLAQATVSASFNHVRHHQRRLLHEYYAGVQADILDSLWKFGGSLLPIDLSHPLKPQMGVIDHRMNSVLDWFFWVPYLDATLRATDAQTIDLDLARGWQVGIVADGLLRTDNERPVGQRMPIPDFTAGDPDLRVKAVVKYAGMDAPALIAEMVRRAKDARDAGLLPT